MNKKHRYHVPERFLRQLWKNQRFDTSNLQTTEGRPVEIRSTGKLNRDGGPDFIGASIRIGGVLFKGDIELHQYDADWNNHQHQRDPKYNSVILHVVLHRNPRASTFRTESQRSVHTLILEDYLTSPYRETWESMILSERAERQSVINCYDRNASLDPAIIRRWLEKLAVERIELKVRRFEERLRELVDEGKRWVSEPPPKYDDVPFGLNPGELPSPVPQYSSLDFRQSRFWEQLVYEGIMEALGYAKNQQPFLKLARSVRLKYLLETLPTGTEERIKTIEAILFGVAGLLPAPHAEYDGESKYHLRELRAIWSERMKSFHGECLSGSEWQFFRLRPENFPTIRLAGAARIVRGFCTKSLFKSLVQILKSERENNSAKMIALREFFVAQAEGFWQTHYRFGERSAQIITMLVGKQRADDVIINVIVPICFLYARIFKDRELRQCSLKILRECPALSSNTVTKTIEAQLIRQKFHLGSALMQQGAVQLYKSYCSEERCSECAVGKLVMDAAAE